MARKFEKSFYDWCVENDHKGWLDLWDYELNGCSPKDIGYGSGKKYYFKCLRGIHESELKNINLLTTNKTNLICKQCNSFGQYLIDTYGEDTLEKYWDYKKNKVDPFEISKSSGKKVWIKCQEKDYHDSYEIICRDFIKGNRCPYCAMMKIHPKDSFGQKLIDNYGEDAIEKYWSKKNKISPFELAPYSHIKIWIKCQNNEKHEDYKIACNNFTKGRRCPKCKESYGERRIREYFNTRNINFIPQKEFADLVGTSEWKPLSYDFYLPNQNLLIEYQGQYHDGATTNQTKKEFLIQQEHDRRKREYAEQNGIRLLEIWYWDYDNIEEILNKNIK